MENAEYKRGRRREVLCSRHKAIVAHFRAVLTANFRLLQAHARRWFAVLRALPFSCNTRCRDCVGSSSVTNVLLSSVHWQEQCAPFAHVSHIPDCARHFHHLIRTKPPSKHPSNWEKSSAAAAAGVSSVIQVLSSPPFLCRHLTSLALPSLPCELHALLLTVRRLRWCLTPA